MMRMRITALMMSVVTLFMSSACDINYDFYDSNWNYDVAIVRMPNGEVIELELAKWKDYEGEQIQLTDTEGNVYLVSSFNCVLKNTK